jgi:hypothetical protein
MLNGPMTGGGQLFTFTLTPLAPPALIGLASLSEFASRRSGELLFDHQSSTEGPGTVASRDVQPAEPASEPDDQSPGPVDEQDDGDEDGPAGGPEGDPGSEESP